MPDPQRLGQLVDRDNGGIAATALKVAEILLTKARTLLHLLLCQAFFPTQAGEISTDQFPHIHAKTVAILHTLSLSTIVCNAEWEVWQLQMVKVTIVALVIGAAIAAGIPIYAHVQEKNTADERARQHKAFAAARDLQIQALEAEVKDIENAQYIVQKVELEAMDLHAQIFGEDEFLNVHGKIQDMYFNIRNQSPTAFEFFPATTTADPESISELRQAMTAAKTELNKKLGEKLTVLKELYEQKIAESNSDIESLQKQFLDNSTPN